MSPVIDFVLFAHVYSGGILRACSALILTSSPPKVIEHHYGSFRGTGGNWLATPPVGGLCDHVQNVETKQSDFKGACCYAQTANSTF